MPYQQWAGPDRGGLLNGMLRELYSRLNGVRPAAEVLRLAYPVGSVYLSVSAADPAERFGFGAWEMAGTLCEDSNPSVRIWKRTA